MEKDSTLAWFRRYRSFNYGEEIKSMTLEEASREAARLAIHDAQHFYRVVPIDKAMTGFRIEKVSKAGEWKRYSERFRRGTEHPDRPPYSYNYR